MNMKPMPIRVEPIGMGTSDYRVFRIDTGEHLCDIEIDLSGIRNASRYHIVIGGQVRQHGTFNFKDWDDATRRDLLSALMKRYYPGSDVLIELETHGGLRKVG